MEPANVVIILVGCVLLAVLLSACCRGLKRAYEIQLTNEERLRRRQAYYITQASRNIQTLSDGRAVRVTTIARDNDSVAYEIYEIHVPPRTRAQAQISHLRPNIHGQNIGNISNNGHNNRVICNPGVPPRRTRRPRTRHAPDVLTPPPPFSLALQVSSPMPKPQDHDHEEPPPSYDDYLKCQTSLEDKTLTGFTSPQQDNNNPSSRY